MKNIFVGGLSIIVLKTRGVAVIPVLVTKNTVHGVCMCVKTKNLIRKSSGHTYKN